MNHKALHGQKYTRPLVFASFISKTKTHDTSCWLVPAARTVLSFGAGDKSRGSEILDINLYTSKYILYEPTRRTHRVDALGVRIQALEYRSGSAQQMPDQFAMRRNTIARPSCHWNSLTIRNCHRRRILHKHNQHPPCSVLDTARHYILHRNR